MVLSTMIVFGAAGFSSVMAERNHLPADSAITFERLLEAFGSELPELDVREIDNGPRRRLELPDIYYDKCVFWINAARSREGLPALQRWRDFEACSDRGAKYDSRANSFHASIERGMYCDWENYLPVAQNTCPHWFYDQDSLESCTMAMWKERNYLKLDDGITNVRRRLGVNEVMCKDGRPGDYCAGHYFNIRGGSKGYNAYDRVACGFFIEGSTIWINQNFGSGEKTNVQALAFPEQFQPYGFACGGDRNTRPPTLLSDGDCLMMPDPYQYDDCRGSYRQDYRWHGCVAGTCDEHYDGPCKDFAVDRKGGFVLDGSGEDICSGKEIEAPCVDPYAINFPKGSKAWFKTREVCRKSCGTCKCTIKPFDIGFRPLSETEAPETEAPETETPETDAPLVVVTPAPETSAPSHDHCAIHGARRKCIKSDSCQWNTEQKCVHFDGDCGKQSKMMCPRSFGCFWNKAQKPFRCSSKPLN